MRAKKLNDGTLYYGRKLPEHSGAFVQKLGGYEKYWEHLRENDIAAPVYKVVGNVDGQDITEFVGLRKINKPQVAIVKVGRNEPCPCGSGKKYKKCCINK